MSSFDSLIEKNYVSCQHEMHNIGAFFARRLFTFAARTDFRFTRYTLNLDLWSFFVDCF